MYMEFIKRFMNKFALWLATFGFSNQLVAFVYEPT